MAQNNRFLAAALAILLGAVGAHKFYLGRVKKGILYVIFSWTLIPMFLGIYSGIKFLMADDKEFQRKYVEGIEGEEPPETENYIMKAAGKNGQITLFEDKARISRKGILSTLTNPFKGDKDIRLEDITSIQFREPGKMTTGYIQIGQSGYSESDDGLFDAASDENSVTFAKGDLEYFQKIRQEIDDRRSSGGKQNRDTAIERLREKYAEGEISEEEYQERKEVLNSE